MVARPLTPDELLKGADLAGYARVVSVRDGRARLRFSKILKGRPKGQEFLHRLGLSHTVTVRLRAPIEEPVLGPWTDAGAYVAGEHVKTHLIWDVEGQVYLTTWWNAVSKVETDTPNGRSAEWVSITRVSDVTGSSGVDPRATLSGRPGWNR